MKIKTAKGGVKLGTWNHRVIRMGSELEPNYMRVCEVHYDARGFAMMWSEGTAISGETRAELLMDLARIERAIGCPILRIKRLDDGKEILVDDTTGERARNVAVEKLRPAQRAELKGMRDALHRVVKGRK